MGLVTMIFFPALPKIALARNDQKGGIYFKIIFFCYTAYNNKINLKIIYYTFYLRFVF